MQQIEIDVIGAQALKRGVQAGLGAFRVGLRPSKALGGDGERFARVALYQRLAHRYFRFTVVVHIGRVEVGAARFHEGIHHLAEMIDVDTLWVVRVGKRQAHAPEAELRRIKKGIAHGGLLYLFNCLQPL